MLQTTSIVPTVDASIRPAGGLSRLGILNDYVRVPYANGSSFASQFLYREFRKRGSEVTVIGARDPKAKPDELPPNHICFASLPLRNHPGVQIPFPDRQGLRQLAEANLSMVVAQTGSSLLEAGLWLRRTRGVPLVCVNTIHLPSVYDVMLPEALHRREGVHTFLRNHVIPWAERTQANIFNGGDGLVVLSKGLKQYWEARGVEVPIWVIPRSVDPSIFNLRPEEDPFPSWAKRGARLLVVCRHTREKNVSRLLKIFAEEILPNCPDASLALVGDGPDHDLFQAEARALGIYERCVFPGEVSLTDTPAWYRAADLFVYTSLSETYGQVVSEALWCGLPVVALHDGKGVADQVEPGVDGFLVSPDVPGADATFARHVLQLVTNPELRKLFALRAEERTRLRADPARCISAYEHAFSESQERCRATWQPASWWQRSLPLVRWTGMHGLLYGLGWLRTPAVVNRHGRKQPVWDAAVGDRRLESPDARARVDLVGNNEAALRLVG